MKVLAAWGPAALYMAATWFVSSLGGHPVSLDRFPLGDKGVHFAEYAVLGGLLGHATRMTWPHRARWRRWLAAVVVAVGWGVLDELHQSFVPKRAADPWDAVADTLGAAIGAALFLLLRGRVWRGVVPEGVHP